MLERIFPILQTEVRVTTDCDELASGLDEVLSCAQPGQPISESVSYHVERTSEGRFIIRQDREPIMECVDSAWTLVYLHHWVMKRVCAGVRGALMIHGGCGTFQGKRFVLCGERGAGKTTLLCRLLFDGALVHSDDLCFLSEKAAKPFPGKFHLKEGTLSLVPQLQPACRALTAYPGPDGDSMYFFDPTAAGFEWTAPAGKVDAFFYLAPDRVGKSEIRRQQKFMMVRDMMFHTLNFASDPRGQINLLCRAVDGGVCYTLHMSGIDNAVNLIKDALS